MVTVIKQSFVLTGPSINYPYTGILRVYKKYFGKTFHTNQQKLEPNRLMRLFIVINKDRMIDKLPQFRTQLNPF